MGPSSCSGALLGSCAQHVGGLSNTPAYGGLLLICGGDLGPEVKMLPWGYLCKLEAGTVRTITVSAILKIRRQPRLLGAPVGWLTWADHSGDYP